MFKIIALVAFVAAVALAGVPVVTNCSPDNVIFTNLRYTWWPMNVNGGDKLHIAFNGDLTAEVTALPLGLIASIDGIPIINNEMNICPFLQNNLTCPVAPGPLAHEMEWLIPNVLMPGIILNFTITLKDQTAAELVCINIDINI